VQVAISYAPHETEPNFLHFGRELVDVDALFSDLTREKRRSFKVYSHMCQSGSFNFLQTVKGRSSYGAYNKAEWQDNVLAVIYARMDRVLRAIATEGHVDQATWKKLKIN